MTELPIKIGQSIATIARLLLLSSWRKILKAPVTLSEKKCIVVGNGPSFKTTFEKYENELKNNPLICVNNFVNSEYYGKLEPQFYIINASVLFYPDQKISSLYIKLRGDIFEALQEKTKWKLYIMVPFIAKKSSAFKILLSKNKNIIPLYYNTTPAEGFSFFTRILFDTGLGMPRPHNVIIPAIMNLIKLNFKDIYITGADHSWLPEISVNEKNEALVNQKHFYDENESKPEKMEDYIDRPRRLHEIIYKFYLSFKGYWIIKDYANKKNVNIYNCSEVSFIDAFERKRLDEI